MDVVVVVRDEPGGPSRHRVHFKKPITVTSAVRYIRWKFWIQDGTIVDDRGSIADVFDKNDEYDFVRGRSALKTIPIGLESQPSLGAVGSGWTVRDLRVVGRAQREYPVYVRSAMMNVWQTLESLSQFNRMIIIGPPGSGKSTLLYGWTRYRCEHHGEAIVHVQYFPLTTEHQVYLCQKDQVTKYRCFDFSPVSKVCDFIEYLVTQHNAEAVVIDGYRENQLLPMICLKRLNNCRVIFAASNELFSLNDRDASSLKSQHDLTICSMHSWTYQEYLAAVEAHCFSHMCFVIGAIERFFYSGGNLKLFHLDDAEITECLTDAIRNVNLHDLACGIEGSSVSTAANILCGTHTRANDLACSTVVSTVSEHAGKLLLKLVDVEALLEATANVFGDKTLYNTWVFEYIVVRSLKERTAIIHGLGFNHAWNKYAELIEIESLADISVKSLKPQTLLIYKGLDNCLFDMVLFESVGQIRLAKITTATSMKFCSTLALDILELMKDEFGKCTLHVDIFAPHLNNDHITVQPSDFYHIEYIAPFDANWVPEKLKADGVYRVLLFEVDWRAVCRKVRNREYVYDSIEPNIFHIPEYTHHAEVSRKRSLPQDLESH